MVPILKKSKSRFIDIYYILFYQSFRLQKFYRKQLMWTNFRRYFTNKFNPSLPKCEICLQPMDNQNSVQLCHCQHAYCRQCISSYVDSNIKSYHVVKCLSEECNSELNEDCQFYRNLPKPTKEKYQKIKRFHFVSKNPSFKLCPKENCIGIVEITKTKSCTCSVCFEKFCPKCMCKQHWWWCQKQSISHLENDLKFIRCTHCQFVIQKNQGCDHIKCRCGHELCYKCGGIWKGPTHLCVRSKGFQKVRELCLAVFQRTKLLLYTPAVQKFKLPITMSLGSIVFFNVLLTLFISILEIMYDMASTVLPFNFAFTQVSQEEAQVCQSGLQESKNPLATGLVSKLAYLFLIIVIVYFVIKNPQLTHLKRKRYIGITLIIVWVFYYILSNFVLILYYEWTFLLFVIQNSHRIAIVGFVIIFIYFLMKDTKLFKILQSMFQ